MTTKLQPEIAEEGLPVPSPESLSPCLCSPALANSSIARCANAWEKAQRAELERNQSETDAARKAGEAYRAALPPLTSRDNCRDFIACVAHGILLGAIPESFGGKLLYAAQVALAVCCAEEKSRELTGYAVYASLTESEAEGVRRQFQPRRSKTQ